MNSQVEQFIRVEHGLDNSDGKANYNTDWRAGRRLLQPGAVQVNIGAQQVSLAGRE